MNFDVLRIPLQRLSGLLMREAGWAGDIAWFQFGGPITVSRPRLGGDRDVGEYALHLSCPWRWVASSGFVRADENSPDSSLEALGAIEARYVDAELTGDGNLALHFDSGDVLTVEGVPGDGAASDDSEYWRLLQPGRSTPHLVVSSVGAEWQEA